MKNVSVPKHKIRFKSILIYLWLTRASHISAKATKKDKQVYFQLAKAVFLSFKCGGYML